VLPCLNSVEQAVWVVAEFLRADIAHPNILSKPDAVDENASARVFGIRSSGYAGQEAVVAACSLPPADEQAEAGCGGEGRE
jgi:hypothetical protein